MSRNNPKSQYKSVLLFKMEKSDEFNLFIEILIENYSTKLKKYILGKQEIVILSFEEFKTLLEDIHDESRLEEFPIKIAVIVDLEDEYEIKPLKSPGLYEIQSKRYINQWYPIKKVATIYEIKDFWSKGEGFKLKFRQKLNAYLKISTSFYFSIVALFAYSFLYIINIEYLNLYFMIFWTWLIFLAIADIFTSILRLRWSEKEDLLYFTPIVGYHQPYNLSRFFLRVTISTSAFILIGIAFIVPELRTQFLNLSPLVRYLLPVLTLILILVSIYSESFKYAEYRKKSNKNLRALTNFIHSEYPNENSKQFYLQFLIEVKNKPNIKIGYFSKFVASLTFIMATLPVITGAF